MDQKKNIAVGFKFVSYDNIFLLLEILKNVRKFPRTEKFSYYNILQRFLMKKKMYTMDVLNLVFNKALKYTNLPVKRKI